MKVHTEETAQETYCHVTFSADSEGRCIGSKCMAWRWSRARETKEYVQACADYMKAHGVSANVAMQKVFAEHGAKYENIEGYCGLAGKPE